MQNCIIFWSYSRAIMVFLGTIIALMFFTACDSNYIFDKRYTLENQEWSYADTLDFQTIISDTTIIYNIYLELEHATNYKKQNLYALIYTKFPTGERLKEQISLELAGKMGQWNGDCNSDWCRLQIPLQEGAYFNRAGEYTFTVEQFMRINPLKGIKSISLKIEETEHRR